jgi:hypothetical protein
MKKNNFKKISRIFSCTSLVSIFLLNQVCFAQTEAGLDGMRPPQSASEYIFRSSPKENLITVQLLGAVQKPGIYYVPSQTDLVRLLTLAGGGGATEFGDLSEVLLRSKDIKNPLASSRWIEPTESNAYEIDVKNLIKFGDPSSVVLKHNDLIYVPHRESWISNDVSKTVSVVSLVMGIVLTGVLIDKSTP